MTSVVREPAASTRPVVGVVTAVTPVVEVDAVFAVATARSLAIAEAHNLAPTPGRTQSLRKRETALNCGKSVELRGFEPLTPSMPYSGRKVNRGH